MSRIAQKEDLSDPDVIAAFAQHGRQRAPPDRAVPADGGRHPRHQPQGLERLEGQAARRPVPADAARARRRAPEPRRRDRGAQARGAPCCSTCASLPGTARGAAVAARWSQLLRAPRRRRDRLARARRCSRHVDTPKPIVQRARCRRSAKACRCWSTRPTSPTCSRASAATSTAPASTSSTPRCTPRAAATRSTPSRSSARTSSRTTAT